MKNATALRGRLSTGTTCVDGTRDIRGGEKELEVMDKMNKNNGWKRLNGEPVSRPYDISLGRREWYAAFSKEISKKIGHESYLLDFLQFKYPYDAHASLLFFIMGADRIDVSLKGISKEQLCDAVVGAGKLVRSLAELKHPHMSLWEINQLVYRHILDRCYFHLAGSMSKEDALEALGSIPILWDRILDDVVIEDSDVVLYKGFPGVDIRPFYRNVGI